MDNLDDGFTIEIICDDCGSSSTVEAELEMVQGVGLLVLECHECSNKAILMDGEI